MKDTFGLRNRDFKVVLKDLRMYSLEIDNDDEDEFRLWADNSTLEVCFVGYGLPYLNYKANFTRKQAALAAIIYNDVQRCLMRKPFKESVRSEYRTASRYRSEWVSMTEYFLLNNPDFQPEKWSNYVVKQWKTSESVDNSRAMLEELMINHGEEIFEILLKDEEFAKMYKDLFENG